MTMKLTTGKLVGLVVTGALLATAVWLVSPFVKIDPSDFYRMSQNGLRLAAGLMIFIIYLGKWAFDVFAPQGLAKPVSGVKATALVVANLALLIFVIFIIAQAASLYLRTAVSQNAPDF
jgi:hypothetical protein